MLLRTTSTPTFRSSAPSSSSSSSSSSSCIDPSSWTDLSRSILSLTSAPVTTSDNRIRRTSSEQLLLMKHPKMKLAFPDDYTFPPLVEETVGSGEETASFMLSASSLVAKVAEGGRVGVSVGGGNGSGGDGGGGRGGGGGGRGGGGGEGNGSESMEAYYQKMVESFPGDALILGNYARFLKDVKGDADRAAEYCERAILAKRQRNDGDDEDGNLLSMYGDIIWKTQKDGVRAQTYFDQAVQSSPNDCFVLASYAQFLWDSGEDDEHEEETELHSKSLSSAAANANQNLTTTT